MVKISKKIMLLTVFITLLVTVLPASAGTVTVCDFEGFNNGDLISAFATHYPGVTFSGGSDIGTATIYNSPGYPPHSGIGVVAFHFDQNNFDNPTQLKATFTQSTSRVGLWYTSYGPVYLEAYDATNNLITSTTGQSNYGTNSYLEVTGSNIAYVIFHDHTNYMTIDDFTFETIDTNIPEFPSIAVPVVSMIGLIFVVGRKKETR